MQFVIACALIGLGWVASRAQATAPDFEFRVTAPAGETNITCVKGCALVWSERGINQNSTPERTFMFRCQGAAVHTCSSGRIAGWIKP